VDRTHVFLEVNPCPKTMTLVCDFRLEHNRAAGSHSCLASKHFSLTRINGVYSSHVGPDDSQAGFCDYCVMQLW
jgi:hypothetical protein